MSKGVVERYLNYAIYTISVDLSTIDTGMDELESEGKMLGERGWARKCRSLGQATDATKGIGR